MIQPGDQPSTCNGFSPWSTASPDVQLTDVDFDPRMERMEFFLHDLIAGLPHPVLHVHLLVVQNRAVPPATRSFAVLAWYKRADILSTSLGAVR